jgi:excinuclease ABC A subunit
VFVELHEERRPDLRRAFAFGLESRVHRVHPRSPIVYVERDAHLLSFNAPKQLGSGACPTCDGLGIATGLDEKTLVVHPERSMHDGAFALWTPKNYRYVNIQHVTIEGLRGREGFDPDVPWRKLPASACTLLLEGANGAVQGIDPKTKKKMGRPMEFLGFRRAIVERASRNTSATRELKAFVGEARCPTCNGTRWSIQARALRVAGCSIDRLLGLPLTLLQGEAKSGTLARKCPAEARPLVANVARTAGSLVSVGLCHLSGDRGMLDVSDGESRRTRLAGVLTSRLAGLILVLDEPARGLHEQDLVSLGDALLEATQLHTVVVSEHRQRIIARADHLIELGPGAGPEGGTVHASGPVQGTEWAHVDRVSPESPRVKPSNWLQMKDVHIHNVEGASVSIPLGAVTCIAGVSGSGKSSFVRGALVPALIGQLPADSVDADDFRTRRGTWSSLRGAEPIDALHALDQAPATAQRRSLVMTFLDVADGIRRAYAAQPEAKRFGFSAADFSINSGKGRCPRCLGLGRLDDDEECPVCGGLRFGIDALAVRVGALSYAELLGSSVAALLEQQLPSELASEVVRSMVELGVGHLSLGRSLDTLSGGEVQRLRIARALAKHKVKNALFVLDEPAGGLHPRDVKRLDSALRHIVERGNTVVLVEHDPHLLATCDHIVEFGPGSGADGGRVIAEGSPAEVRNGNTPTGMALRGLPKQAPGRRPGPAAASTAPATRESALRARAEMRQILGDDVQVPDDDDGLVTPSAIMPANDRERRPLELADLDSAAISVLLDAVRPDVDAQIEDAARTWGTTPLRLMIHPLLDAIATWGRRIPRSVVKEIKAHRAAMGISWSSRDGDDPLELRATGPRFEVGHISDEKRRTALRDALAVGGGYLELVDSRGKVYRRVHDRLVDWKNGIVGPRHATPAHFRRLDRGGACPTCKGKGVVMQLNRKLLIAQPSGRVLEDKSLDARASEILKGVWRAEMLPFFKRLAEEGLWDADARWSKLDDDAEAAVMHGFWIRPSHGTFLKAGSKNDGSEVGHWLRWDGLVSAVDGQLPRSKNSAWREAVSASRREARCPTCRGTGLGPNASLLTNGKRTLEEWARQGSLDGFLEALEALPGLPPRAIRERERLAHCLAPLRVSDPPLGRPATGPAVVEVMRRAALEFADVALVAE